MAIFLLPITFLINPVQSEKPGQNTAFDEQVQKFLDSHIDRWHDMNVPATDGKLLFDLIIENDYKKALDIGTSTGHSALWMAWALSKTGGKLITVEIDEDRHKQALANFEQAGLSEYIEAQLGDAHELVPELKGPFDFVFCDADKEWYKNYFTAVSAKLEPGACYSTHNVLNRRHSGNGGGIEEFLDYVQSLPNYETRIDSTSRAGVSISYKKSEK